MEGTSPRYYLIVSLVVLCYVVGKSHVYLHVHYCLMELLNVCRFFELAPVSAIWQAIAINGFYVCATHHTHQAHAYMEHHTHAHA